MITFSFDEELPFETLPNEDEKARGLDLNYRGHEGLTKEEFKELVLLYKKGWEIIRPDAPFEIPPEFIEAWS